ncbi:MAG: cobalamin-dependent protein [Verrucomicrobia bacterium]|nr:cobalamin-dependent protein [Verrucomicrobiota bacterium]
MLPIRLLTAVPICDGHDSAINTINLELIRHGFEVIYLGYHRGAAEIVRAAIQEDVKAIGISTYNGGHVEFFADLSRLLHEAGAGDIKIFGGGGATITHADESLMLSQGTDRIYFAGTPLTQMMEEIEQRYGGGRLTAVPQGASQDVAFSRALSGAEEGEGGGAWNGPRFGSTGRSRVIGITGPGGVGKTTLIDELVLRFLKSEPNGRVAVLSHDPSILGKGALLGDRATMIYSQNDRVFMRSLGTRGQAGGLAPTTERCLRYLRSAGFDLILVETVGIGQEAAPFGRDLVDKTMFVMGPDYGSRLQLQKIVMLDVADLVVVNKSDQSGARTASAEVEQRIAANKQGQRLYTTCAKRHRDKGVNELYQVLMAVE